MNRDRPIELFWRSWTVPKDGNRPEQNEDAARIESLPTANSAGGWLIAVADGATEAVYSGLWARTLVAAAEPDWPTLSDDDLSKRLDQVRRSFSPISPGEQTPWYVRNKFLAQGSQATLLAVTVESTGDVDELIICAVSVGDCCLLLFKGNGEICTFPVHTSEDFGLHPDLVRNRPQPSLNYYRWEARFEPGDFLLACTDAVGKWVLQCVESNQAAPLFAALLGLLAPVTSEPTVLAEAPSVTNPLPPSPQVSAVEDEPAGEDHEENCSLLGRLHRLIQRLRPRESSPESPETDRPESNRQALPEPASSPSLDFVQFIERYRAPESRPRMRNDDATLVVCLPIQSAGSEQHLEVMEILRRHEAAAALTHSVVRQSLPAKNSVQLATRTFRKRQRGRII